MRIQVLIAAALLCLLGSAPAQSTKTGRISIERVKGNHPVDITGDVVGFSCTTTSVTNAECYVAVRQ